MSIFKKINYKNRRMLFESFIFGNDFFLLKYRNSENLFIDATFHIVPEFT
jgi:hypothetical protein